MKLIYGLTWWGKQFLNSLEKIDFDNRIPRGYRYANNGSVLSIDVKKNTIHAAVQGSRPKPYSVKITVPEFSTSEKKELLLRIQKDPVIRAAIANHELLPRVLESNKSHKIRVFPESWKDFQMACSCPDFAIPCKHIAAVIYIVSQHIDRDALFLFRLKGFDLDNAQFVNSGVSTNLLPILNTMDLISSFKTHTQVKTEVPIHEISAMPDMSKIPDLGNYLFKLLDEKPPFWKGDFRDELDKRLRTAAKNSSQWMRLQKQEIYDDEAVLLRSGYKLSIEFDESFTPLFLLQKPRSKKESEIEMGAFLRALITIQPNELAALHISVQHAWNMFNTTMMLLMKTSLRPVFIRTPKEFYKILWFPVKHVPELTETLKWIEQHVSADIFVQQGNKHRKNISIHPDHAASLAVSVFAGRIISEFAFDPIEYLRKDRKPFDATPITRDPVIDMFFGSMAVRFTGFGSDSVPQAINKWLSVFDITQKKWTPIVVVSENRSNSFRLRIDVQNTSDAIAKIIRLPEFLKSNEHPDIISDLLISLRMLSAVIPETNQVIDKGTEVVVEVEKLIELLFEKKQLLQLLGVELLLPTSLKNLVRPKVTVKLNKSTKENETFFGLDGLLSYDWQIAIGNQTISVEEFQKLISHTSSLVWYKNQYVLIAPDQLDSIVKRMQNPESISPHRLLQTAFSGEFEGAPVHISKDIQKWIDDINRVKEIAIPATVKAKLRPYQKRGFSWMYKNLKLGLGSIIADDMGLGKTLQVICVLEKMRLEKVLENSPALVVLPTSLISNWQKEIEQFTPLLKTEVFHGVARNFPKKGFHVLLTSYGTLRSDINQFSQKKWGVLITDEAQNIKNPDTAQSKAVRSVPALRKIAMTGTPVENRLSDYWSIFDFALPGYLGSLKQFIQEFSIPITRFQNEQQLKLFHSITKPFIMRRVKTDPTIISDLPEKMVNDIWCHLEKKQAGLYENVVRDIMDKISSMEEGIQRRGMVLKLLTSLKQVCNHPVQFLKKGKPTVANSGKLETLLSILETAIAQNEKCLIFTQYREMGDILVALLEKEFNTTVPFLHGGLSRKQRDNLISEFTDNPAQKIFILSLKAGGTGLNLTMANHVIHYDLWWNPAVENQATDRAFRIGQKKNVMVYRLLCKGTLEEKINDMLNSKRALARLTVNDGENWIGDLSTKELQQLVALER